MVWDEANIELCEAGKDAQMKIDEPNTPYNFLLMSRSESEDEGDGEDRETATRVPPPQSLDEALKRLTSEQEVDDEGLTEEERERKHAEFEEHRRKHYNEFLAVKRYREEKLRKLRDEGCADAGADDADDDADVDEEEDEDEKKKEKEEQ